MCIKNNYSKRELDRQIGSGYYQRYMLSDGKANQGLAKVEGDEDGKEKFIGGEPEIFGKVSVMK